MFHQDRDFRQVGFSEPVEQALSCAGEEAVRMRHGYIGTEHQLLGVLRADGGTIAELLERLNAVPEEIRSTLESAVRPGKASPASAGKLPYTSRAKKVLEFAMAEAREVGESVFGQEHLLVGLLREEKGIAAEVLHRHGITLERVRSAIRALPGSEPRAGFRVQIDDASSQSIYEQITAQIQEAVATGDLRPGDRLPAVRTLADQLGIAPGTVGRAYNELERLGIVVTQGARGTRVAERKRRGVLHAGGPETLVGLFRPLVVAAFHLGASAEDLHAALNEAMLDIFARGGQPAPQRES